MIETTSLTLEHKSLFDKYKSSLPSLSYEYLFSTLYIWKNLSNPKILLINDMLVVEKFEEEKGRFFMMPYGNTQNKLPNLVESLLSIDKADNRHFLLGDVDNNFIRNLSFISNYKFHISEDINDFEYIYSTKDLIELTGSKYHHKRTHYNNFNNLYKPEIIDVPSKSNMDDIINFLTQWKKRKNNCSKELQLEENMICNAIRNSNFLGLKIMAIYINGEIAGFTIGEKSGDTVIIHSEICNINYRGIYAYINREFLYNYFQDTLYVNRQEDCGDLGLRKSKESYYPLYKLKKYLISIE